MRLCPLIYNICCLEMSCVLCLNLYIFVCACVWGAHVCIYIYKPIVNEKANNSIDK